MCEICHQRKAKHFLRVSQPQDDHLHVAKAHACAPCFDVLREDNSLTVEVISQSDYNDLPENKP